MTVLQALGIDSSFRRFGFALRQTKPSQLRLPTEKGKKAAVLEDKYRRS